MESYTGMWSKCEAEMWCLCYDFSCFQTLAALHLDLYHSKTNSKINLFLQYCNSFARNPILFFALQNWYFSQSLSIFEEKKHRKSRFFTAGRLLCGFLGWLAGLAGAIFQNFRNLNLRFPNPYMKLTYFLIRKNQHAEGKSNKNNAKIDAFSSNFQLIFVWFLTRFSTLVKRFN